MQVPAARALVQYVYTGILPEYAQHPEQEPLLVHMLHLANHYQVQDCAAACLHALMATPQLQPETVHLVYSLLSEATDLPGLAQLMEHCSNHLHQQFGNLEATMSDGDLIDKLHKLPHAGMASSPCLCQFHQVMNASCKAGTCTVFKAYQMYAAWTSCRAF